MKKAIILSFIILLLACNTSTKEPNLPFPEGQWIDLTHDFDENTIFWPTAESFELDTVFAGMTEGGYYYSAFQFCLAEHGGTHLDAPVHFAKGKWSVDEIPLESGIGKAVVVDVSKKATENPDYLISVSDVEAWEKNFGTIPEGSHSIVSNRLWKILA